MRNKAKAKANFIRELAEFLVNEVASKSIELEMGKPHAKAWARLRNATPLFGWLSVEEAIKELTEFLE